MKVHLHKGQDFSVILARNKNRKSGPYESARSYLYLSTQNLEPSIVLKARDRNPSGRKNIVKLLISVFELHDYMVQHQAMRRKSKAARTWQSRFLTSRCFPTTFQWQPFGVNKMMHQIMIYRNSSKKKKLVEGIWSMITLYNTKIVKLLCTIFQCNSWTYRLCNIIYVPACLWKLSPLLLP